MTILYDILIKYGKSTYYIGDLNIVKDNVLSEITSISRDDWDSPWNRGRKVSLYSKYEGDQIKQEILHDYIPRAYLEKLRDGMSIKVSYLIDMVRTLPLDSEENYAMFSFYSMILCHCMNKFDVDEVNDKYLVIYWCSPCGWSSDEEDEYEDGYGIKKAID